MSDNNVIKFGNQGLQQFPDGDPAQRRACAADAGH